MDSVSCLEALAPALTLPLPAQLASRLCHVLHFFTWLASRSSHSAMAFFLSSCAEASCFFLASITCSIPSHLHAGRSIPATKFDVQRTVDTCQSADTSMMFDTRANLALSLPACSSILPEGGQLLGCRCHSRLQVGNILCGWHHHLVQQLGNDIHICILHGANLQGSSVSSA